MALPRRMRAVHLQALAGGDQTPPPLVMAETPVPRPERGEVLLRVIACGVCHTELDEMDGRAAPPELPVIPGHQVVGEVVRAGDDAGRAWLGLRVGVGWIHSACGTCTFCRTGRENLCANFRGCGRDRDGGYAEYMIARTDYIHAIPESLDPVEAAPLLCAGAVGWRALEMARIANGDVLGLTGFGASAHLVLQMARHRYPDSPILVFARHPDDREWALELGAHWSGDTEERPPQPCQAVIDTTPAWRPVLAALRALSPGGRLVINAIAKETGDIQQLLKLDYTEHLWREKSIQSVANVTRADLRACLDAAAAMALKPTVERYVLEQANQALQDLRLGRGRGARVLVL